jgi:outer membrane protein
MTTRAFPLSLMLLAAGCPKAPDSSRYVVIDVQRVVTECKAGLEAKERLKARFTEKQAALNLEQEKLKTLMADAGVDPERKQALAEGLQLLQQRFVEDQKELQALEASETGALMGPMGKVLDALAKERNYLAVLDTQSVPWAAPEVDITNEVIKRMDAR